jgi:DNA-binding beta-propeller fold protein YncE
MNPHQSVTTGVSRRSFLNHLSCSAATVVIAPYFLFPSKAKADAQKPLLLGSGKHQYEWIRGWAKLPDGMRFGNTHGAVVIDSQGRVLMNTDSENAVIIFDPQGKFIKTWGKEFQGGTHGMALHKEGKTEYLYLTHHTLNQFAKCTLDGEVVWRKGYPEAPGIYQKPQEFKPTGIAIAPSGDFYVTDGYGKSWVHQYTAAGDYVRSFGGPGTEEGKLRQPHGIWIDTREKTPTVLVADRANHRLQWFSLEGKFLRMVTEDLRLPSNFHQRGTDLVIADLAGRVTILDRHNKLITHLGDNPNEKQRGNNPVPPEQWVDGIFISPHCVRWDADGNLYVVEWLSSGRINKLKRCK